MASNLKTDISVAKILCEGKLCLHKKNLYVGLQDGDLYHSIRYDSLHTGNDIKTIKSEEIELKADQKDQKIKTEILKSFKKTKVPTTSINWIKCIENFIKIENLFMFIISSNSKDYSSFLELCVDNLENIAWDISDEYGNTMMHYTMIMNSYPEVACKIIDHTSSSDKYKNLIHKSNNYGFVPLVYILLPEFRTGLGRDSYANKKIISRIIEKGASLLSRREDGTFAWKSENEVHFATLKSDKNTVILSSLFFYDVEDKKAYRICCWPKDVPDCRLVSGNDSIPLQNFTPNLILQILKFPCHKVVTSLFSKNVRYNSPIPVDSTVIHFVASKQSLPILAHVIKLMEDDWLVKDANSNTILHSVIMGNREKNINYILEKCPNIQFKIMWKTPNIQNKSPLDLILEQNMVDLLRLFIVKYPELISSICTSGNTLFHFAVINKKLELLRYLSTQMLDNRDFSNTINAENSQNKSPLMLCVENKFVEGLNILLATNCCSREIAKHHGCNLLHLAVYFYHPECFSEILSHLGTYNNKFMFIPIFWPENPSETGRSLGKHVGLTPLFLSMILEHFDAAKLLIAKGAKIDQLDSDNHNFYYFLILKCKDKDNLEDFFKIQLKSQNYENFESSLCSDLFTNETILYLSLKLNNTVAFEMLLPRSTVNMLAYQDSESQNNVLHLALSLKTDHSFLKSILDKLKCMKEDGTEINSVINAYNKQGQTPLLLLVEKGDVDGIDCLLKLGCDVTAKYYQNSTNILHHAVEQKNPEIVKILLSKIDKKNEFVSKRNSCKLTPLHLAIKNKKIETLKFLLALDSDLVPQHIVEDVTLIKYAIKHCGSNFNLVFDKIKGNGSVLSRSFHDGSSEHPVHYAVTCKNEFVLDILLLYDTSFLELKTVDGLTLLHHAIRHKFDAGAKLLIKMGQTLTYTTSQNQISILSDIHKQTPLFAENRIGYKLALGYVLISIPSLDITEYQEQITSCKNFENFLVNLVSCRIIEPIQCYLKNPLRPISPTELSLIASQHANLDVLNFLFDTNLSRPLKFEFDLTGKTKSQDTVIHMGVYNPYKDAFDFLINRVKQSEVSIFSYFYVKLLDKRNQKYQSALDLAISENKQESFNILIKHGASLGKENDTTVLHYFLTCKNPNNCFLDCILKNFSKSDEDYINFKDKNGQTPLHLAVQTGNKLAYQKIISDTTYAKTTKQGNNILHLAIKNKDPELFKMIIQDLRRLEEKTAKSEQLMYKPNTANKSPIFYALDEGNIELFLNEPDIGIEGVGENGSSLLHYAVLIQDTHGKQIEMMKSLISKGELLLNARDSNKQTPLHYAVIHGRLNALEYLLQHSAVDLTCQDSHDNTVLHCGAESKKNEACLLYIIKHLKEQHPDLLRKLLNTPNSETMTPLYSAIQARNVEGIKILRNAGAELPIKQDDGTISFCNTKLSPLSLFKVKMVDLPGFCIGFEIMKLSKGIVSDLPDLRKTYFIESDWDKVAEIKDVDEDELKRSILPCHSFDPLDLFIDKLIPKKFRNDARLSHLAASNGSLEVVTFLFKRKEFPYLERDRRGYSIHHYAIENNNKQILMYLCEQSKNLHPGEFKKLSGTLLDFAIKHDHFEAFKILLEERLHSDLHYADQHEDTLLHLIINNGRDVGYTKVLLASSHFNSSEYCNRRNNNAKTALNIAIAKKQLENVDEILKHLPDISITDNEQNTALHIAVDQSTEEIIKKIIQYVCTLPDKNRLMDASNGTKPSNKPIHLAMLRGTIEVVELLLENGAELYGVNGDGKTIFHLAVQLKLSTRVSLLKSILDFETTYSNRSEKSFIHRKDDRGNTPLHLAVYEKHNDVIELLLTQQIDLTLKNRVGQTVLHSSIQTQTDSSFNLILNAYEQHSVIRCNFDSQRLLCTQDDEGRSGLHLSIKLQYHHAVQSLLSNSVCIDSRDKHGMTLLHYAAKFHQDSNGIIQLIVSHILDVEIGDLEHRGEIVPILNAADHDGRSPLMLAIESTHFEAIDAILNCGPEFVSFDKEGRSVLHYAADKNEQILLRIIEAIKQASLETDEYLKLVNSLNVSGLTALHLSVASCSVETAKCLVREGARLALAKDSDNSVQTIGMDGLSGKKELCVGAYDEIGLEHNCKHVVWYMVTSEQFIYSTLPRLDDVEFSEKVTDFKKSTQQVVISSVLESNCPDILKSLLGLRQIDSEDKIEDLTLIELAGEHASLPMMQFLCEKYKFRFENRDNSGRTVIHHVIYNPSIYVVDYLLKKVEVYEKTPYMEELPSRIIDLTDNSDCSPLKFCIEEERWDNFTVLIKNGADFGQKDANENTILHLMILNSRNDKAASKGLECLLKAIMQSNLSQKRRLAMLDATNKTGLTALHLAVTKCNTTAAILLINAGVDLTNIRPSDGFTVVHTCVSNAETKSNLELMNALSTAVKSYDDTQYEMHKVMHKKNIKGYTSLYLAIHLNRSAKVIEILLSKGAPFTVGNFLGNTPLHLSAKNDLPLHVKTILYFIQKDARDRGYGLSYRRERCMKEIMRKNNKKEMPILLTKDKDILICMLNFWNYEVMLPLDPYRNGHLIHFAVYNQLKELFEAILETQHSSRSEMLISRDSEGMTPLHIAAEKNDFEIGEKLIGKGVDININSTRGTPVQVAIKSDKIEFATKLIDKGADVKGFVFLLANNLISEKSVTRILDNKLLKISDIYSTADCSVIHYAARQSSIARIKFLLGKNADLCAKDRDGRGALHHAISSRRKLNVLTAILDEAYRIDIKNPEAPNLESLLDCDYEGLTPGMLAAQLDYVEFFEMICTEKYSFHLDTFHYADKHGDNLVHQMVKCTSMRCIRFLLPYLARNYQEGFSYIMNGRNVLGYSPIALARGKGQLETVNMIVELCDADFFEFCPDVVHRITDEEDNNTLVSILDKMIICNAKRAVMSTKIMDSNEEGGYPDFGIFNYFLSPLWHKMYTSGTNRIKYHPLLKFAVDAKIRLYKWWYSLMLLLYLLFYIPMVAALLIASHHCDESLFHYRTPLDILRLLLEVYIIILTLLYMLNESIELLGKWQYLKNLPSVSRKLAYQQPNNIKYYGLENLEGYLFSGVLTVLIELPHKIKYLVYRFDRNYTDHLLRAVYEHMTSSYSILELASVIFLLQLFASRMILFYTRTPEASEVHWTLAALTFIFYTFKFFKYTKIFPTLGIYIETIFKVLKKDVPRFMLIIFLILIGYAGGAHLISRRFNQASLSTTPDGHCTANLWLTSDFDTVYSIITPLLSGVLFLLDGGPSNFELEIYQVHIIFSIFYLIFAFGIIVVLLNIFIAQLSQTYSDVNSDKDIIDYKAELALNYEQHSNIAFILKWFFSKALRRIMVETVSVPIEEWNSYLKFYSDRIERDSDVVYHDLNRNYLEEARDRELARLKAEINHLKQSKLDLTEDNLDLKRREEFHLESKKREEPITNQLSRLQEIISQLHSDLRPNNEVKRTDSTA